ncbi:response regulator transcription factor [Planctomycetota bacterium]
MGKHRNYHIFVVDDEPQVCKAISRILQQKYKVTSFESAEACLVRLRASACKCNLLISDFKMPGMNGIELLLKVKRIRPRLKVLLITGYGDVSLAVRAMKAGARDFIEKPLHRDKLLEAAESALGEHIIYDPELGKALTKIQREILKLIKKGLTNRQIAEIRGRSIRTIEDHRHKLMRKLGAGNLAELLRIAQKIDLSDPD